MPFSEPRFAARGRVHAILPEKQVTEKFRVRVFVLAMGEDTKWPQYIPFQVTNDMCDDLDDSRIAEGAIVNVGFRLKGREWTGKDGEAKYFLNLQVPPGAIEIVRPAMDNDAEVAAAKEEEDSDLPF